MIHGIIGDESQACFAEPLPKHYVLAHYRGLELLFLCEVEDLEGSLHCFEGDDLLGPVHDGTVSLDGPPHDVVAILHLNDDDLGGIGRLLGLTNAYVAVRFEGLRRVSASIRTLTAPRKYSHMC